MSVPVRVGLWPIQFHNFIGVPPKSHSENLKEVIALLLEDGEPRLETEFVGTHKEK